ncbi:MAG: DUF4091 domain-containing protein [Myxococcales bacterium]|nr:DUF4091 domain-containing protein [Myxococcales bacterium]
MRPVTVFLGLVIGFLAIALAVPAAASYKVGLTHGTNKHRPEFDFDALTTYHIYAAQNEWEPFQVLIRNDAAVTNIDVVVDEFTGPGAAITQIEPYRVAYVPVTIDTISQNPPDPSNVGMWPDGLVPFVDHFVGETRDGAPFDLEADFAQAVFVDVFIPADQTPGDYTATVTVTADGHADWTGTVTLTVWDFAIPTGLSLASIYQFGENAAYEFHQAHGGVTDFDTLWLRYMQEFARHRISISDSFSNPGYVWNYDTSTFDWDWSAFDAKFGPLWDGTFYRPGFQFTSLRLPYPPGGRPGDVAEEDWEREWWAGWADHFRDHGWTDILFLYLPDEPDPSEYPELADLADRLHNADPDLRAMVTEQINDVLTDHVDIWTPDEPLFSDSLPWPPYPEAYDERRAAGDTTWWYNCVSASMGMDYATHFVDYESTHMRIWTWLTRRYGFTGILFWHTNWLLPEIDPWVSMWAAQFFVQGDGTIIYPGTIDHIGGETDIPVASLRMKYLREAMEDYEYFHLLDQRGDAEWMSAVARTAAPKTYHWEKDWSVLLDWRRKVAEKILGVLDEDAPNPPSDLQATAQVEAIAVTWTKPAAADLAGFEIWYGLHENDSFFGGTLDATATGAVVNGLLPGREYRVWAKAFDTNGNRSATSDVVTAVPLADEESDDDNDDDAKGDDDDNGSTDRNGVSADPLPENSADDDAAAGCGGWR